MFILYFLNNTSTQYFDNMIVFFAANIFTSFNEYPLSLLKKLTVERMV